MRTRPTLTIEQACEKAGVSRRTMYYWAQKGQVESVTANGAIRIYADNIERRRGHEPSSKDSNKPE